MGEDSHVHSKDPMGTSLAVQWFRLCTCTVWGMGSDPWSRPKSEKKEKNCREQVPSLGMGPRFVSAPRLETADKPRPLEPPVPQATAVGRRLRSSL